MRQLQHSALACFGVFVCLVLSVRSHGQNLIPNPSFEKNIGLPTKIGCWFLCNHWNNVNMVKSTQAGSPDYFHSDSKSNMSPPKTQFGVVEPHSGKALMGLLLYQFAKNEYREYISIELKSPLKVGAAYEFSFWCTTGVTAPKNQSYAAFNGISVAYSGSPLKQTGYAPIHLTPTWQSKSGECDSTWQKLSFSFVADSAYQYLTIGMFDKKEQFDPKAIEEATVHGIYYFVDDFELRKRKPEKGRIG